MAWNGSPGTVAGQPGFISYTSLRESPLEDAIKNFMISHANLPRRARLWTFGASAHADADGWTGGPGTTISPSRGALKGGSNSAEGASIESPGELALRPRDYRAVVLQTNAPPDATRISVQGQGIDGEWVTLIPQRTLSSAPATRAGRLLELPLTETEFVRLRIAWASDSRSEFAIRQIALYPR